MRISIFLLLLWASVIPIFAQKIDSLLLLELNESMSNHTPIVLHDFVIYSAPPYFDQKGEDQLRTIVSFLQGNNKIRIHIQRHSDCRGTENYNLKLSQWEAGKIQDWLRQRGLSEDRVNASGFGEIAPKISCTPCSRCTDEDHQRNRRVEIVFVR